MARPMGRADTPDLMWSNFYADLKAAVVASGRGLESARFSTIPNNSTADADEGAGNRSDFPPVLHVHQHREQKYDHPHGARIDAVHEPDQQRQRGQPPSRGRARVGTTEPRCLPEPPRVVRRSVRKGRLRRQEAAPHAYPQQPARRVEAAETMAGQPKPEMAAEPFESCAHWSPRCAQTHTSAYSFERDGLRRRPPASDRVKTRRRQAPMVGDATRLVGNERQG